MSYPELPRRITMKSKYTTIFGALLALALLAGACGGGDDSDDQALIDAVAAQISADGDVPPGVDVECMSAATVNGLGGAAAMEEEYGLTVDTINDGQEPDDVELPVDDARSMAEGMLNCGLDDFMVDAIVGEGISEDAATCLLDNMDGDAMRDSLAAQFMNSADAARIGEAADAAMGESLFASVSECNISLEDIGF